MIYDTRYGRVGGKLFRIAAQEAGLLPALEAAGFVVEVRCTDEVEEGLGKLCTTEEMAREIRETRPDVVIVRDGFQGTAARWKFAGDELADCAGLVEPCRKLGIPVIVRTQFYRGIVNCWKSGVWDALQEGGAKLEQMRDDLGTRGLWRANGIIANSDFCTDVINGYLREPRCETEWPTIPLETVRVKGERTPETILLPSGQFGNGLELFVKLAREFPD